jgi:hypothetical protein
MLAATGFSGDQAMLSGLNHYLGDHGWLPVEHSSARRLASLQVVGSRLTETCESSEARHGCSLPTYRPKDHCE